MQHALHLIEEASHIALPILASATDVRELVQYLKKKSAGITVVEASDAIKKRLFDPRKVAAYETWGIISKSGDRMKLSELGLAFAKTLGPETEIYRGMLDRTPPYRGLLNWVYEHDLDLVTFTDIIDYWEVHFPGAIQQGEKHSKGHVDTFLQLCQAAEIGQATVGRKGQPSRLKVDRNELAAYVEGNQLKAPESLLRKDGQIETYRLKAIAPKLQRCERVFISAPREAKIVNSIRNVLGIAELECEVVERDAGRGILVPALTRTAMSRCHAGIIIVNNTNPEILIEIGAAVAHFGPRLIVLCEQELREALHIEALSVLAFEDDDLNWNTGLELVKTLKPQAPA